MNEAKTIKDMAKIDAFGFIIISKIKIKVIVKNSINNKKI